MAEIRRIAGAEQPVNDGERRVFEYLEQHLPTDFVVYPGVQIIHQGRTDDVDLLILTPHALVVVEVKDIAGELVIDNGQCYVNDELRPQPFNVTNAKARRLKSRLEAADPRLRHVWVAPLVILAREPKSLRLNPPILNEGVMTLDRAVEKLTDPARLVRPHQPRELGDLRAGVERVLGLFRGRDRDVRFGAYECVELLDRNDDEDLWRARHRVTGGEVEIRHIGRNPATRQVRVREAEGEVAAIRLISDTPWIDGPLEMLDQDDGSIALIYPPRQGATLAELLDAGEDIQTERIILDVTSALEAAHAAGVSHGRLAPRWIEVLPDVVKVRGFSLARGEGVAAATRLLEADEAFMAPEMLHREAAGAPADIYALGKLIGMLKPNDPTMQNLARRLTDEAVEERRVPAGYIREALARAFGIETFGSASDPDDHIALARMAAMPAQNIVYDEDGRLAPGSVVGNHIITQHLGSGGFSDVYLVTHPLGHKARTLKVFKDPEAENFVAHEFSVLEGIDDPNVVRVHDAGHSDAGWYMVSEYLAGQTLAERVDSFDGTANTGDVCLIGYELLTALQTIHEREIFHRDVKPENVILVPDRGAVLFDFGVAASRRAQIDGLTISYWPPNVPAGANLPDPDLFAVGVVLCELLTGEHPYPNKNPHAGDQPDTSRLPPGLSQILERAVHPDLAIRFRSASDFRDELEPFVDRTRSIDVSRRSVYRRVEQLIAEDKLDEAEALCNPQWKRLQQRIARKRASQRPGARRFAGLEIRFVEEKDESVASLDNSGPTPAHTWTYNVEGRAGLMIDVRVAEQTDGTIYAMTTEAFGAEPPISWLKDRLRLGAKEEGDLRVIRLRWAERLVDRFHRIRPSGVGELDDLTGVDVESALRDGGAEAVGRRSELGFDNPANQKNEIAVTTRHEARVETCLRAYLLTTVVPVARELGLLLDD